MFKYSGELVDITDLDGPILVYISDAIKNHTHHLAIIAIYTDGLQCDPGSSEHNGGGENRNSVQEPWII